MTTPLRRFSPFLISIRKIGRLCGTCWTDVLCGSSAMSGRLFAAARLPLNALSGVGGNVRFRPWLSILQRPT